MRLVLRILNGAITAALLLAIAAAGTLAFTARRSPDGIPTVLGHKVLAVVSGSMEPAIHTGDVIIVKPMAPDQEVRDGDIVTYRVHEKPDMLVTHRVVGTVKVNGEPVAYVTKGDANPDKDLATIGRDQIVGTYRWRILYFGYISAFLRKPIGIVLVVILPGLVLVGLEFRKMWQILNEAEKAKAEAAVEGGEQQAE